MGHSRYLPFVGLAAIVVPGCSWFRLEAVPADVEEAFRNGGDPTCNADARRADRVATGVDERDGAEVELWIAPTDDGDAVAVLMTEPGQPRMNFGAMCMHGDGRELACCSISMEGEGGMERSITFGQAPAEASTIRARSGGEERFIDVGAGGYFVVVQSQPGDGDNMVGIAEPQLTALDADGIELEP